MRIGVTYNTLMRIAPHFILLCWLLITACRGPATATTLPPSPPTRANTPLPTETTVMLIPLTGPIGKPEAEISGLAWYSDTLILLPQYPARFGAGDGVLFAIPRQEIAAYLRGETTQPIQPAEIPLVAPGAAKIAGFEGFEAIAFSEERVYLTIEANLGKMVAYLVSGKIAPDLSQITLNSEPRARLAAQTGIANLSDEAILIAGESVITFYEANGAALNPQPTAHQFDLALTPQGSLPFPNLEYRLTDATALDATGRFWVINYFYPGDSHLRPKTDPPAGGVERLLEYQFSANGLTRTDTPPLNLTLAAEARNWEGIVRFEADGLAPGFLLATDKFPATLLGYANFPWQK